MPGLRGDFFLSGLSGNVDWSMLFVNISRSFVGGKADELPMELDSMSSPKSFWKKLNKWYKKKIFFLKVRKEKERQFS